MAIQNYKVRIKAENEGISLKTAFFTLRVLKL